MAWVIARIWASVNDPRSGEPRCPLVPNSTSWPGSSRSGRRSKYSRSSRTGSISISFGAGLPASGEMVIGRSSLGLGYRTGLGVPDLGGILGDRAIARELPGTGDIEDGFARPLMLVGVQVGQPVIRLEIGAEVGKMHEVITSCQQRVMQRSENPGFKAAEIVGRDRVQRGAGFRIVVVVPSRAVPAAAALDLVRGQPKQEEIVLAGLLRHLDRRAIAGAERQRSVQHKFHVAGAARFVPGSRDLVRNIGGRDQPLGQ